jgi:hypothetical protein
MIPLEAAVASSELYENKQSNKFTINKKASLRFDRDLPLTG